MKNVLLLIMATVFILDSASFAQSINSKDKAILIKVRKIHIYEIDHNKAGCSPFKTSLFLENSKVPTCFVLRRRLNTSVSKQIINILCDESSFQNQNPDCFTTNYGLLLLSEHNKIIGGIATSTSCGNISLNGARPYKLTDRAINKLNRFIKQ